MRPTARRRSRFAALFESLEIRRLLAFTIGSLTDSPDPVNRGVPLTLTANNVVDSAGRAFEIDFYLESNGVPGLQAGDTTIRFDDDGSNGFSLNFSTDILGLTPGRYTFYAVARDVGGLSSPAASTTAYVTYTPDRYEPNEGFLMAT